MSASARTPATIAVHLRNEDGSIANTIIPSGVAQRIWERDLCRQVRALVGNDLFPHATFLEIQAIFALKAPILDYKELVEDERLRQEAVLYLIDLRRSHFRQAHPLPWEMRVNPESALKDSVTQRFDDARKHAFAKGSPSKDVTAGAPAQPANTIVGRWSGVVRSPSPFRPPVIPAPSPDRESSVDAPMKDAVEQSEIEILHDRSRSQSLGSPRGSPTHSPNHELAVDTAPEEVMKSIEDSLSPSTSPLSSARDLSPDTVMEDAANPIEDEPARSKSPSLELKSPPWDWSRHTTPSGLVNENTDTSALEGTTLNTSPVPSTAKAILEISALRFGPPTAPSLLVTFQGVDFDALLDPARPGTMLAPSPATAGAAKRKLATAVSAARAIRVGEVALTVARQTPSSLLAVVQGVILEDIVQPQSKRTKTTYASTPTDSSNGNASQTSSPTPSVTDLTSDTDSNSPTTRQTRRGKRVTRAFPSSNTSNAPESRYPKRNLRTVDPQGSNNTEYGAKDKTVGAGMPSYDPDHEYDPEYEMMVNNDEPRREKTVSPEYQEEGSEGSEGSEDAASEGSAEDGENGGDEEILDTANSRGFKG